MPMVPGSPSYGYGGWGTSPHAGAGSAGLYQWGLLIGSTAIGLTALGKGYQLVGIPSTPVRRFLWSLLIGAQGSIAPPETSSGGGGPGGVLTSAAPPSLTSYRGGRPQGLGRPPGGAPSSAEGLGRLIISAHGGGRSGAKPRKRCPVGYRWNGRRCVKAEWLEYGEAANFAIGAYRAYRDR